MIPVDVRPVIMTYVVVHCYLTFSGEAIDLPGYRVRKEQEQGSLTPGNQLRQRKTGSIVRKWNRFPRGVYNNQAHATYHSSNLYERPVPAVQWTHRKWNLPFPERHVLWNSGTTFRKSYKEINNEIAETLCGVEHRARRNQRPSMRKERRSPRRFYPRMRYDYDLQDHPEPFVLNLGCSCDRLADCNRGSPQVYGSLYNAQCGHLGVDFVCCCHDASDLDLHRRPAYVGRPVRYGDLHYMYVIHR